MTGARAGILEVWAARAWNVFNEGRPFSIVYPAMVLVAAVPAGLAPDGPLGLALVGTVVLAGVLSRFSFPLRGRALLWLGAAACVPLLEPWRAPGLLLGALAGYVFFTVFFWGSLYYRLRTGAPWTNFTRFWRLVATNSDPTSGNALEQVPKWLLTLSAGTLLAEEPTAGSVARIAVAAAVCAGLGVVAWRRWRATRMPRYPAREAAREPGAPRARRVYVIVVDGCNRERLWQADTPVMDRLAREGTEYLAVEPAYPARTVVCFSSMLTGAAPEQHGMHSNFAPRLGVRVESIFDVLERSGRRGRMVGIAHLLDPFGERVVRAVTSVQPTAAIDGSLAAAARAVVEEEDPDLLVLQLLAADQLGHVRGVRNPEYLDQLGDTDRQVGDFLAFLAERGKLDGATVVLMADHGQGRGIGGHGHLDWGERPVPFIVWGEGAVPGGTSREPRSVAELAVTISDLLGVRAPEAARGRPLVPDADPLVAAPPAVERRCLVAMVNHDGEPPLAAVLDGLPRYACGMRLDGVVAEDGAAILQRAREARYDAAVFLDGTRGHNAGEFERLLEPIARGRADYVCGSRFLGPRDGLAQRPTLGDRSASVLLGALLGGTVVTDGRTGCLALSGRALRLADCSPGHEFAPLMTLSLWGAGIDAVEVPVSSLHPSGRPSVGHPEYLARVAPAVWRQWRASRATRAASAQATPAASTYDQVPPSKNGSTSVSGPNGASGRGPTSPPSPTRTSR